jgi:hypothetical protein
MPVANAIYQQVLDLARVQAGHLSTGDLDAAVALLDERAALLAGASPPTASEMPLASEIVALDRQLSSAIRERMHAIRNEVMEGHHGKQALAGYGRRLPEKPLAIDRLR